MVHWCPLWHRYSYGTLVSTVAPVTTVAPMVSQLPLPTGMATVGPGSNPAQPTMAYLLQLMQGLVGQVVPQHSVAAQGIPVPGFITQPPVPRTGVANVLSTQVNYIVQCTLGGIPCTGSTSATGSAGLFPGSGHLAHPPVVPRLQGVDQLANQGVNSHTQGSHSSQSEPVGSRSSRAPSSSPVPMEQNPYDEDIRAYSSSDDTVSSDADVSEDGYPDHLASEVSGVRAASVGRIPANKVAQQTATATFTANMAIAMKYLPRETFPPPATPKLQKTFAMSADPQPPAPAFLQFLPSQGFADAFRLAQASYLGQGTSLLKGEDRATTKFVRSIAKFPKEKLIPMGLYTPLTPLWSNSTKAQDDLAPLLRFSGQDKMSLPKFTLNQSMFNLLEQNTRAPLNVLSYLDWFVDFSRHCLRELQGKLSKVGQSPQTDLNFLEAVSLSKELSGLLAQQGDMVNHLVALPVHAAAQVITMRRDSYLAYLSPLVAAKNCCNPQVWQHLGPDLFEPGFVSHALAQFNKLTKSKQQETMVKSMVTVAKAATKRPGQPATQGPGKSKQPRSNPHAKPSNSKAEPRQRQWQAPPRGAPVPEAGKKKGKSRQGRGKKPQQA